MPRMTYNGTTGATVTYGITDADKSEDTAPTGTGVTADLVGAVRTAYSVVVPDTKRGMTIDWYEDGEYIDSEEIPADVLTPLAVVDGLVDGLDASIAAIAADYAKTDEAASAVAALGSPLQADDERIAALALEASVQEVAAAVAGLEPADLGTDTCTLTILSAAGEVVADARVFVSADAAGTIRSATKVTNALGQVTFDLTDGETFYVWRYSSTVDFSSDNPQEFVAIED